MVRDEPDLILLILNSDYPHGHVNSHSIPGVFSADKHMPFFKVSQGTRTTGNFSFPNTNATSTKTAAAT